MFCVKKQYSKDEGKYFCLTVPSEIQAKLYIKLKLSELHTPEGFFAHSTPHASGGTSKNSGALITRLNRG